MNTPALIETLNKDLDAGLAENISDEGLYQQLFLFIENLINNNFFQLVFLLYKVDVSEQKLTGILRDCQGVNAAKVITDLVIERELQKIESRKAFKSDPDHSSGEPW